VSKRDSIPTGFCLHRSSEQYDRFGPIELLVPTVVHEEIEDERDLVAKRREDAALLAHPKPPPLPEVDKLARRLACDPPKAQAERAKVAQQVERQRHRQDKLFAVYDPYEPVRLLERQASTPDKELHKRDDELFRRLSAKGWLRKIAIPLAFEPKLANLAHEQPAFREVISFVRGHLCLARNTRQPPRIPPLLLYGEPGVGKTHFAHSLAQVLGTTWRRQPFDNAETASALLGSDRHWANTRYGLLFEMLALGDYANPVIVLDELDKAARQATRYDPLGPLHTLLEPFTAAHVRDLSLDFELDTRLVTWIATANDHLLLPQPILSRLRVFHIRQPQGEDAIRTAQGVITETLRKVLPSSLTIDREVAVALAHLTPRELLQATEDAAAAAADAGHRNLRISDLPAWALGEDEVGEPPLLH
jgi:hypothetical protein